MRGIQCAEAGCTHLHAKTDEELVRTLREHAAEVHPETSMDVLAARRIVASEAYDDQEHEPKKGMSWGDFAGGVGGGGGGTG